jgi:hypothetical protein
VVRPGAGATMMACSREWGEVAGEYSGKRARLACRRAGAGVRRQRSGATRRALPHRSACGRVVTSLRERGDRGRAERLTLEELAAYRRELGRERSPFTVRRRA